MLKRALLIIALWGVIGCAGTKEQMDKQGVKVKGTTVLKVFKF